MDTEKAREIQRIRSDIKREFMIHPHEFLPKVGSLSFDFSPRALTIKDGYTLGKGIYFITGYDVYQNMLKIPLYRIYDKDFENVQVHMFNDVKKGTEGNIILASKATYTTKIPGHREELKYEPLNEKEVQKITENIDGCLKDKGFAVLEVR